MDIINEQLLDQISLKVIRWYLEEHKQYAEGLAQKSDHWAYLWNLHYHTDMLYTQFLIS